MKSSLARGSGHAAALALSAGLILASPSPAHAEGFDIQIFRPATSTTGTFTQEGVRTLPHLSPFASLTLDWGHKLLVARNGDTGSTLPGGNVVGDRVTAHLALALGLFNRLELGVRVPTVVYQDGNLAYVEPGASLGRTVFGDLTAGAKVRIAGDVGMGLAAGVDATFPTGAQDEFAGGGSASLHPYLVIGWNDDDLSAGLNVGYRLRGADEAINIEVDDEFTAGLGMAFNLSDHRTWALAEAYLQRGVSAHASQRETPAEGLIGVRTRLPAHLFLQVGAGAGLTRGYGTPEVRALFALGFAPHLAPPPPEAPTDRDGDRILDVVDKCPDDPEDYDRFEDEDGCPEDDNDKDTVPDHKDRCPLVPGPVENKGCPDLDTDEDGIPNRTDKCPEMKEDRDGFEDEDGCPDDDNDKDGILDVVDKCPNDPEDVDQFEDNDGCPEPDNDKDGFLDGADKCPNEAEIFNGIEDDDGCPDKGKELAKLEGDKVEIREQVFFEVDKDVIREKSFPLLATVAKILSLHTEIKAVRVEGHTDSTGTRDHNMKLSQARADSVRKHLTEKGGIAAERLESVGYGPDRPIGSNKTSAGKAKNRRVEFVVIGRESDSAPAAAPAPATAPTTAPAP